jgi:hypothetical protein
MRRSRKKSSGFAEMSVMLTLLRAEEGKQRLGRARSEN